MPKNRRQRTLVLLIAGNGFVKVQYNAGNGRPRGKFGLVLLGVGGFGADLEEGLGRAGVALILLEVPGGNFGE